MSLDNVDTVIGFVVVILLLSLVVTTIVQMVVWLTNLRGVNLAWGVHKLFREFSGLDKTAAQLLARKVLEHPGLATFAGRKITAIRKEELLRLLPDTLSRIEKLDAKEAPDPIKSSLRRSVSSQWVREAHAALQTIEAAQPAAAEKLRAGLDRVSDSGVVVKEAVETWF